MAYTTINKHTAHFNTKLWVGNQTAGKAITGVGFQPDLVWIKDRTNANHHRATDSVRGVGKGLIPSLDWAEQTEATGVTSFDSDGFTVSTNSDYNANSANMVSWNWKGGGTGSSNSDGSITSTVSANTTAGFSVVKYTGAGGNSTVGHGLGVKPKIIIIKRLDSANGWIMYNEVLGHSKYMILNTNAVEASNSTFFNATSPTSSVFTVGNDAGVNGGSNTCVAYCFAEKIGFSRFGHYKGNASSDGVFVYTGFKPSWLMIKRTNSSENWHIFDIKRNPQYPTSSSYGGMATRLMANLNNSTDLSQGGFEFLSNGLKMTTNWAGGNGSGDTFIYMCFGQSLVGSNNIPCTAR